MAFWQWTGEGLAMFDPDICNLGDIDMPVLLVAGEYDVSQFRVDLEKDSRRFKNAFSKGLVSTFLQENAGHTCMHHKNYQTLFDSIHLWLTSWFD